MHLCSKVSHLSRSIRHGAALLKRLSLQPHIRKKFLSSASGLDAGLADKPVHQLEDSAVLQETCRKLDIPEPEFDFKYLCDPKNTETIRKNVHNRKGVGDIDKVVSLWTELQKRINVSYRDRCKSHEELDLAELKSRLKEEAKKIPNLTHPDVPIGGEDENRLVEVVGEKRELSFKCRNLTTLGEDMKMCRIRNLGKCVGHRSYFLMDGFAKLEQALIRYAIDNLLKRGFELMSVPDLVHPAIVEGCGFQIHGEKTQIYRVAPRHGDIMLAATGEIPIGGYFMNSKFSEKELPKKVCTVSRCFRAEADEAAGEGLYRVHQFTKVEMFALSTEQQSEEILEELIRIQRDLFANLGLHFRVMDMASHELGGPAYRKYDIEAWLTVPKFWGEVSSASNCTDYQSRRLNIKYADSEGTLRHVHTLNGTACAIPRTIMALVESNQNKDWSIDIPPALQPYMRGLQKIIQSPNSPKRKWISTIVDKKIRKDK